jgi:hypothetical protein
MLVVGVLGCGEGTRELPDADRARLAEQLAVDIRRFSVQVRPAFYQWLVPIPRGGFAASVYPQITFDRPGHCAFLNSGDALINRHGHYLRLNACYRSADASDTLGIHAVAVAVGDVTTTAEYRYEVGSIWGHSRLESSPSGEPVEASDHQTGSFDLYRAVAEAPDSVPVRIELIGDRGTRTYLLTAEEREGWCYFTRCWKTDGYTQHPLVARMLSVARSARN